MNRMNEAALHKVWNEETTKTRQSVDYIGRLQPEREAGPRVGQLTYTAATTVSEQEGGFHDVISYDVSFICRQGLVCLYQDQTKLYLELYVYLAPILCALV